MGMLKVGYFTLARNVSKYSDHKYQIGCVIANHKPFAVGWNIDKTSPKIANPATSIRNSVHAEMRAIRNSGREKVKNATAYIYREDKNGNPALALPCLHCLSMLKSFGVKKIYYTINTFPYYKMERI